MRPNNPRIAAKISMVRILTNLNVSANRHCYAQVAEETHSAGSAASASAALLPLMPTQTPQIRLHIPTVNPAQNRAYPVNMLEAVYICSTSVSWVSLEEKMMAMMTP
jgi:hypothetical protein